MTKPLILLGIAASALCVAAPASANFSQDTDADEAEAVDGINVSNRIICRRLPPPVGQRFGGGRRICATEAQWENYRRETRNLLDETFNRSKASSH